MEEASPWAKLLAVLEPVYPKGERGRDGGERGRRDPDGGTVARAGDEVPADAGYPEVAKRAESGALGRTIDWPIASQRSLIKALAEGAEKAKLKAVEKATLGWRTW